MVEAARDSDSDKETKESILNNIENFKELNQENEITEKNFKR